jgi:acetyl esterase/lipase
MLGSRALIYRLAAHGWVCVSAGRRQLRAGHSEQLADTRAALAWVRQNAQACGGDPERVFAAGGSAGANLAATAALTGSDVAAVIGLYGYYGKMSAGPEPSSPHQVIGPDAPPVLLVHGSLDTLVPHQRARAFVDRLRALSHRPVVHAELPGAHHSFDVFQSIRFHAVTDAIVRFAELSTGTHGAREPARPSRGAEPEEPPDGVGHRRTERSR